jgi:hypothetical protein
VHARRASRPQIPDAWRHVASDAVGFALLEVDADGARADIDITIIASDRGLPARAEARQPNRPAALATELRADEDTIWGQPARVGAAPFRRERAGRVFSRPCRRRRDRA